MLNRAAGALLGAAVGDALAGGGGAGWVSVTSTALASLGPAPDLRSALGEVAEAGAGVLWALAIRHTVLTGELDASTVGALYKEFARLAREGGCHISLNLADVTYLDSTGLSVLV